MEQEEYENTNNDELTDEGIEPQETLADNSDHQEGEINDQTDVTNDDVVNIEEAENEADKTTEGNHEEQIEADLEQANKEINDDVEEEKTVEELREANADAPTESQDVDTNAEVETEAVEQVPKDRETTDAVDESEDKAEVEAEQIENMEENAEQVLEDREAADDVDESEDKAEVEAEQIENMEENAEQVLEDREADDAVDESEGKVEIDDNEEDNLGGEESRTDEKHSEGEIDTSKQIEDKETDEIQEVEGRHGLGDDGIDKSSSPRQDEETQDEMLLTQDTRMEEPSRATMAPMGLVPHPTMATGQGTELLKDEDVTKSEEDTCTATVKFVLMPSGQVITKALPLSTDNLGLVQSVSADVKIPTQFIQILFNGVEMVETVNLHGLGIDPNGTVAFEVMSTDPDNYPLKAPPQTEAIGMSDVITVKIPYSDGSVKETIVEIDRVKRKKPYLGGYRHKKTGVEFYHASAQTYGPVRPPPAVERFSRDTQTVEQKHTVQQTSNSTSTQMTKPGFYVTNLSDKLITPHKYETADEYKDRMLKKVIIVQTYYRRWLAQKRVNQLRAKRDAREAYEKDLELKKRRDKEERIQREFERRMNPKTKEDFDLLYDALEKWRQEEVNRINITLTGAERKAALCLLLDQETELIAAIDRHQLDASAENKEKAIQKLLGKAAASKSFKSKTGHTIKIDTAYTLRGKELLEIYNSLNMKYLTQDERLDVLLTLKHTVKEHDCKLTHEIVELIDREADLLMRGVKEDNLKGLRKRIATLFLQYCKTPTFNPEITHLLRVPQDPSTLKNDVNFCNSCGRYLPATAFNLGIQSDSLGKCRTCLRKDNIARIRQDQSFYRHLLHSLRKEEERYADNAKIAFLIEEADLRYLVENMWNSKSILSSWDDQADLEMVRWRIDEEWSPWNCVYLTRDEAESHRKVKNLGETYGDMLVHKVDQKHVIASNHFLRLRTIAAKMESTLKIQSVQEHKANNQVASSA